MSLKLEISQDKILKKTFEHQKTDFEAFKWLLNNQGQSTDWAIRYGGWEVKITDEQTGEVDYYKPYDRIQR